jgi:gliding motility-associated-like protein
VDDAETTEENRAVSIAILGNDIKDANDTYNLNSLHVITGKEPKHGAVRVDHQTGIVTYIPEAGYVGIDQFDYEICNIAGICDQATVTITILDRNHPPVATDDEAKATRAGNVLVSIMDNDTDPDNDIEQLHILSQPTSGAKLTVNTDNTVTVDYANVPNFIGADFFEYEICDSKGNCDRAEVTIIVTDPNGEVVVVTEALTPNGDGFNDTYVIPGIENFPNNEFIVFNRWGNIVYQKDGYLNEWNGKANRGNVIGEDLPVGVYYYILRLNDGVHKSRAGWIYLTR